MAEILPLRAWRYNCQLSKSIESLTSPLFDVVSSKQLQRLYKNSFNSIHISVPVGENAHDEAAILLEKWKQEKVLMQDRLPAIYVYYQYYSLPGSSKEYCRKGFICNIKAYDWNDKVILRHESTIPSSVNDRISLLEKTLLNVSPTHGLYTDEEFELEKYMDESILSPIYETEDYQGVRDVLSIIQDVEIIKKFINKIKNKQIILADGHHRYESSLYLRKQIAASNPNHTGEEAYNYHLMYLTNTEADNLRILPTHRLISNINNLNIDDFLLNLGEYFIIKELEQPYDVNEIILGKKWAFGLILKEKTYKLRLKAELINEISWNFPMEVKELDLTVLHYFVFEKILGIKRNEQRSTPILSYERNFVECVAKVLNEEVQMAFITNDISMDDVKKVCYSGYTMPQKSTYFYPKVICGFLFSSIKQDEFESIVNPCFKLS